MNINSLIFQALDGSGITPLYAKRDDNTDYPLMVFHISQDIVEEYEEGYFVKYLIYCNLYSPLKKLESNVVEIIKLMRKKGFKMMDNFNAEYYDEQLKIGVKAFGFYITEEILY